MTRSLFCCKVWEEKHSRGQTNQDVTDDAQFVFVVRSWFWGVIVVLRGMAQNAHLKGLLSDLSQVLFMPVGCFILLHITKRPHATL